MSKLTDEQRRVVNSQARLLAVDAFAGSGKTWTLVEYAKERSKLRILYIAFNRSIADEARTRFPSNVQCKTTHGIAYGAVGKNFADKLGNAQAWQVAQAFSCNPRRAKQVLQALSAWMCSTATEIGVEHVDLEEVVDAMEAAVIADTARAVFEKMQDLRSPIKMPHDGYLKLWAMQKPRLSYDVILLDEAQDTNPVTLDLVMAQRHATIVLVGDRHQGIYGFRKAMNAMEAVEADERIAITQSFRFGQGIADVATKLLQQFKGEALAVRGRTDINVVWTIDRNQPYAVLCRTNAGLFNEAATLVQERAERRLHFVGGFDSYLFGKVLDAYHLWVDDRAKIKEPSIGRFNSFHEFRDYGNDASDAEVKALVKTVETYRGEVPRIYDLIRAADTPDARMAKITMTTGHKAKGLEWDQVKLGDDFFDPNEPVPPEEFDEEEVNLLYVAVTRAIRAIQLPMSLERWLKDPRRPSQVRAVTPTTPSQADKRAEVQVANADQRVFNSDGERLQWLRQNVSRFGPEARAEIQFLLALLDKTCNALEDVLKQPHLA